MAGLQDRLDNVFGNLGSETTAPAWRPAQQQVFRDGNQDASSDEEYAELSRREVGPGLAMDLAEDDAPDQQGFRPSAAFCRQLDAELEQDANDDIAEGLSEEPRPPPSTQVLENNVYDQILSQKSGDSAPMDEDTISQTPSSSVSMQSTGSAGNLNLKSNLRRDPRPHGILKKRVSFTGIPEPPKPWVPPHKRGNFVSKFHDTAPPPGSSPPPINNKVRLLESLGEYKVPDHIKHPERYRKYNFGVRGGVVVGGGIQQNKEEEGDGTMNKEVQETMNMASQQSQSTGEPEEERWQGAVGAGIEFRPKKSENISIKESKESKNAGIGASFDWNNDADEDDAMVAEERESLTISSGKAGGGRSNQRKYKLTE